MQMLDSKADRSTSQIPPQQETPTYEKVATIPESIDKELDEDDFPF